MNLRTAPQRGFNFDYILWLFTRLTALAMYAVATIGVVGALIMGARNQMNMADLMRWAFTPEYNHVLLTNVPNIDTWKTLFWQGMGILMVLLAGSHGYHGLQNVLDDYVTHRAWQLVLRVLVVLIWIFMSVVAIALILKY